MTFSLLYGTLKHANHDLVISYRKPPLIKFLGEITSIVTGGKSLARDFNIPN